MLRYRSAMARGTGQRVVQLRLVVLFLLARSLGPGRRQHGVSLGVSAATRTWRSSSPDPPRRPCRLALVAVAPHEQLAVRQRPQVLAVGRAEGANAACHICRASGELTGSGPIGSFGSL